MTEQLNNIMSAAKDDFRDAAKENNFPISKEMLDAYLDKLEEKANSMGYILMTEKELEETKRHAEQCSAACILTIFSQFRPVSMNFGIVWNMVAKEYGLLGEEDE